jgi:hypothetical protein
VTAADSDVAKVDLCANLALQFARLGRRALVIDLDAALPNVGFRMGLLPEFYLRHLEEDAQPCLQRGPLGVRVLEGVAGVACRLTDVLGQALAEPDCILVNLPANSDGLQHLQTLQRQADAATLQKRRPAAATASEPNANPYGRRHTTMAVAGSQSRMIGQWLQTARRAATPRPDIDPSMSTELDALLYVERHETQSATLERIRSWQSALGTVPVHLVRWVDAPAMRGEGRHHVSATAAAAVSATVSANASPVSQPRRAAVGGRGPLPWATLRDATVASGLRLPASLLYPEHDTSRVYESLAQSLLARGRSQGGVDVRPR